ncbi:unnamed protein product, partial [Rotaria sp. Silwood1]
WRMAGNMSTARQYPKSSVLSNGKVLITGGYTNGDTYLNSAELYDPATGTWTVTGNMSTGRWEHGSSLLQNGKVLVNGGWNG